MIARLESGPALAGDVVFLSVDVPADFAAVVSDPRDGCECGFLVEELSLGAAGMPDSGRHQICARVRVVEDLPGGVVYELLDRDEVEGSPGTGYRRRPRAGS